DFRQFVSMPPRSLWGTAAFFCMEPDRSCSPSIAGCCSSAVECAPQRAESAQHGIWAEDGQSRRTGVENAWHTAASETSNEEAPWDRCHTSVRADLRFGLQLRRRDV